MPPDSRPDWCKVPITGSVAALSDIAPDLRAQLRDGPDSADAFHRAFARLAALREVETGGTAPRGAATGTLTVAAWNVERLTHPRPIAQTLLRSRADVCCLSEVDLGMARSDNAHRPADLARDLQQCYAYGVEFVELGRGNAAEQARTFADNARGFHGNALLSGLTLHRPAVLRLEADGAWFGPERGQRRVGSRMAVAGQVLLDGRAVTVVSVHLESHSNPEQRREQTRRLLDLIRIYDADAPIVIGGDFNTSTVDRAQALPTGDDPLRLLRVEAHEPLFALMADQGFDWRGCNLADVPTQRFAAGSTRPKAKLDWIFTRGLAARSCAILPALCDDGSPSSDHDGLLVEVQLA